MKIGVTGNIGSGKTFLCRKLQEHGFKVMFSDEVVRDIYISHQDKLVDIYGDDVLTKGIIDKKKASTKFFSDKAIKHKVETLIKELVYKRFLDEQPDFFESAVIFEMNIESWFDRLILVEAPINLRIERILKRDNCTIEQAMLKINSQIQHKHENFDFIYNNNFEALFQYLEHDICRKQS